MSEFKKTEKMTDNYKNKTIKYVSDQRKFHIYDVIPSKYAIMCLSWVNGGEEFSIFNSDDYEITLKEYNKIIEKCLEPHDTSYRIKNNEDNVYLI